MAILSPTKTYFTVQDGDTLSDVANSFKKYTGGASAKQLAAMNNIPNPDLIYVGQKIQLTDTGSSTTTKPAAVTVDINQFGLQSNAENTLFVTWDWTRDNDTENFKVEWSYDTGDGIWFIGEDATVNHKQDLYSIPSNAKKVRVRVKPVSKKQTVNKVETDIYVGKWTSYETWTVERPPVTPNTPTVEIKEFKLTAKLDNINTDNGTDQIEFEVVKNNSSTAFSTKKANITARYASYVFTIQAGGEYKVRARAYNSKAKVYSEWSDYSSSLGTIPSAPGGITSIKATSKTSIYLAWSVASNAETYELEYATKKTYFDGSDQTTSVSNIEFNHYEKTGLESGQEYFFRVRAVNKDGHSSWSEIKSIIIGSAPTAPTTWSSTTTAIVGETVNLYWVHNAEDGSSETYAQLEIYMDGDKRTIDIKNTETDEDEKDKTKLYSIDTSKLVEGAQIQWRVRTAGVTKEYGDWSIQRTVDIYAPPTLTLNVTDLSGNAFDTLTAFPFYVYAIAGPTTQAPIGYHVEIISNEIYETTDNVGKVQTVNAGEAVYSKYFDITESLLVEMSPGNVNLDNNINYTLNCTVSMNSGLTAEASTDFTVAWVDSWYSPNAEIGIDPETLVAHIRPYCEEGTLTRYKVTKSGTKYTKTTETIVGGVYGELIAGATTSTGEVVYNGTLADGSTTYYCEVETRTLVEDISLSLYRREFDGSFTELATGLQNTIGTFVTDPHPALDYARYRVVAVTNSTGAVSFYDVPGYPTGITDIVLQWDEEWSNFDTNNEDELQQPPWSGSMIRLPYDIDVSESSKPDVSLVNYTGRSHPVSYYGTHVGQTATWNTNIPYYDKDTIYALRRLQRWMGDVYVREPSGSGYWANITVQVSQKHCDVYVPVTLSITRVEGGI